MANETNKIVSLAKSEHHSPEELSNILNNVEVLDLDHKNLLQVDIKRLLNTLEENKSIKSLKIAEFKRIDLAHNDEDSNYNYDSTHPNYNLGESLKSLLQKNNSIKSISLSACIPPECIKDFCLGLSQNTTLKTLEFIDIDLNAGETLALAHAIENHPKLETLNLSKNQIGDTGLAAICSSLTHNTSVKQLNLSYNTNIFNLMPLAKLLMVNKTLTDLNISGIRVNDQDTKALGTALGANDALKQLTVIGNDIKITSVY